jgi:hypothetical protein
MQHTGGHIGEPATTVPLLGEALVSSAALKALLPAVPKIHPQLPTFNQTVQINNTAQACNETEINKNRTAEQPRLFCNSTNTNGTNSTVPNVEGKGNLPGIGFFKNLQDMNDKFMEDTKEGKNQTKPAPGSNAFLAAKLASLPGGGLSTGKAVPDQFAAWTQQRQGKPGGQKPPDIGVAAKLAALGAGGGEKQAGKQRPKAPIGPQRYKAPIGPQKPPGLASSSSSSSSGGGGGSRMAIAAKKPAQQ